MELAPETMREGFYPIVAMAISQMPADSITKLVSDLESARDETGEVDVARLIEVGKSFGLTDEMIAGYQASYGALNP